MPGGLGWGWVSGIRQTIVSETGAGPVQGCPFSRPSFIFLPILVQFRSGSVPLRYRRSPVYGLVACRIDFDQII